MGTIMDRNGIDLTEAEDSTRTLEAGKRWARLAQARAASRPGLCAKAKEKRKDIPI